MFGLLTIDEGPLLSMTAGPAVPQLLLVWAEVWVLHAKESLGEKLWQAKLLVSVSVYGPTCRLKSETAMLSRFRLSSSVNISTVLCSRTVVWVIRQSATFLVSLRLKSSRSFINASSLSAIITSWFSLCFWLSICLLLSMNEMGVFFLISQKLFWMITMVEYPQKVIT